MHKRILLFLFLFPLGYTMGQLNLTPYSRIGLGEIFNPTSSRNFSMGGLGIGLTDPTNINSLNPASYSSIKLTTYDFSGTIAYRKQATESVTNSFLTGNFYNAALAFRTNKKITFVAGLSPFTGTNYRIQVPDTIFQGTDTLAYNVRYQAKGGINELNFGVGFTVLKKLNIGLKLPVLFGSTRYQWITQFEKNLEVGYVSKRISLSGFNPRIGVQYEDTLKFNRTVDLYKENQGKLREIASEQKKLESKISDVIKEKEKAAAKDKSLEPEREKLEAQKKAVKEKEDAARASNALSESDLDKLENRYRKYNNRKKRIDQKAQKTKKKIQDKERSLTRTHDRNKVSENAILEKQKAILADSTKRKEVRKDSILFCLGGVFDPPVILKGQKLTEYTNFQVNDTLQNITGGTTLPLRIGAGFSFYKPGKWVVGADFSRQQWGNFSIFDENYQLKPSWSINAGGEYIRETFSNHFFRKVAWRGGLFFESSELELKGHTIVRYGINVGIGIPLARAIKDMNEKPYLSRINLGFSFGTQGTVSDGLIKESFVMMRIGVNLNDRWFKKRNLE